MGESIIRDLESQGLQLNKEKQSCVGKHRYDIFTVQFVCCYKMVATQFKPFLITENILNCFPAWGQVRSDNELGSLFELWGWCILIN